MFRSHAVDGLFVLGGLFFEFASEFCDVSFAFLVEFHLRTAKKITCQNISRSIADKDKR